MIHVFAKTFTPNVTLSQEDAFHLFSVLRLKEHERFQLVFEGQAYLAEVPNLMTKQIIILQKLVLTTEHAHARILFLPLLKGEKLEWTIQKAIELGVTSIQLFTSRFTVVDWQADQWGKKSERLNKIIHEAAMQSHRLIIPTLMAPQLLNHILMSPIQGLKCIALETERHDALKLVQIMQPGQQHHVLIGPEGGFDENEISLAKNHHWHAYSLGSRILRSETAALASLAILAQGLDNLK
jgi:16S rRNA (uracil1498-N3)-methyltransferase